MNKRFFLLAGLCLFVLQSSIAQSPWTQKAKEGYFQLGVSNIGPYDGIYGGAIDRIELPREVQDFTIQAYGEYGITDKLTFVGSIPLKSLSVGDTSGTFPGLSLIEEGSQFSIGNVNLGARYSLYEGVVNVAAQLLVELPAGALDESTGLRPGLDAFSIKPTISVGAGLGKGFVYGHVGLPLRTNNYSHSLQAGIEGGYKFLDLIYLIGYIEVLNSFENGDRIEDPRNIQTGLYLNDQQYFAYGIKAIVELFDGKSGFNVSFGSASSGRFVARSQAVSFGLFYKLAKK